jgi:cytochrome P450
VHDIAAEEIKKIFALMLKRHKGGVLPGHRKPRDLAGRIDIPLGFARRVSIAVAQHYFGLTDPTDLARFGISPLPPPSRPRPVEFPDPRPLLDPTFPCVANWVATLNGAFIHGAFGRHFTFDPATAQQLLARVPQVRKEVATHLALLIEELQNRPSTEPATILQRMVAAEPLDSSENRAEQKQKLEEKITRNLVGMVNGMVDNVTAAVCNAMDFFLSHPSAQEMAREVAQKVTSATDALRKQAYRRELWGLTREALRFNAPVPFLLRIANEDLVLAPGANTHSERKAAVSQRVLGHDG